MKRLSPRVLDPSAVSWKPRIERRFFQPKVNSEVFNLVPFMVFNNQVFTVVFFGLIGASLFLLPLQAQIRLTEVMANNTRTLPDEEGAHPDWMEIHNRTANDPPQHLVRQFSCRLHPRQPGGEGYATWLLIHQRTDSHSHPQ